MFWGSDQGTNFTIASKEMKGIISDIDEHKVNKFCLQRDTKWLFNPPAASHMWRPGGGGLGLCTRAWTQAQYLADIPVFRRRWTKGYLPTLLEQKKWNAKKRNLRVGNAILIADENYPRGTWPLVRVVKVVTGSDGLACSATVRTTSTVATRSRRKRKEETSVSSYSHTSNCKVVCWRWMKKILKISCRYTLRRTVKQLLLF